MRPIGKYRFKLPGEKQELEDYYFAINTANSIFMLRALRAYYFWIPAMRGITIECWSCVIRKAEL